MTLTEDEQIYFYLGQLTLNLAHRSMRGRMLAAVSPSSTPAEVSQLASLRDSLATNALSGDQTGKFTIDAKTGQRIAITGRIMRAAAHDALEFGGEWWYDPSAVDGTTSWFPGGANNPNNC